MRQRRKHVFLSSNHQVKLLLCSLHCCLLLSGIEAIIRIPLDVTIQPNIPLLLTVKFSNGHV